MVDKKTVPQTKEDYAKIVQAIGNISDSAKAMRMSGLSRDATCVLIKHATSLPLGTIKRVLDAAEDLRLWCLKQ